MRILFHRLRVVGACALVLAVSGEAAAQDLTTLTRYDGVWLLDESRSDAPVMGPQAPRATRVEALALEFTQVVGGMSVRRTRPTRVDDRIYGLAARLLDSQGAAENKVTTTPESILLETWQTVPLPGGEDTVYEQHTCTIDDSGALIVTSHLRTRAGQLTRRAVYTRQAVAR
jgi:hypothetical protein